MPAFRPTQTDADQMKQVRSLTNEPREALNRLLSDTFLGRKTQEPFPVEDPMGRPDIQKLINSELKPPE